MSVEIVTDSTSDLSAHISKDLNIDIIPAVINFGNESYLDGININAKEFVDKIKNNKSIFPTTAAPSLGEYIEIYKKKAGNILSIHLGSKFSAIYNSAIEASKEFKNKKITAFDSGTSSLALGFMAINAAVWIKEKLPLNEILIRLENMKKKTKVFVSLDTLEFAKRGGRISHLKALGASLLNLKPILEISNNELKESNRFIRKRTDSLNKLVEITKNYLPLEKVGIVHVGAEKEAKEVADKISIFYKGEIMFSELGPALSSHAGPGAIAVAFVSV